MVKVNQVIFYQKTQGYRSALSDPAQGVKALFRDALHHFTQQFVLPAPVFQ